MDQPNATAKRMDESIIRRALLPILSIIKPKNGLETADMMYGIPNRYPASSGVKPYLVWRSPVTIYKYGRILAYVITQLPVSNQNEIGKV